MTYTQLVDKFITKVMAIYNSNPKRREPGDGSDGYCDCIGLPIGSLKRMGYKWTGIHGSNYAARKETVNLQAIKSESQLSVGDIVYKAVPKGHKNWALPGRYWSGKSYYNGDLNDYYHAGVVESVNPLRIRHMSAKMTTDYKVAQYYPWNYFGKLRLLVKNATDQPDPEPNPDNFKKAVVFANSGSTVNMRAIASKSGKIITRVKLGSTVNLLEPGDVWARVSYGNKSGYMMAEFLDVVGDGKGKY